MGTTSLLFVIKIPFLIVSRPCSPAPFLLPFILGWDLDSPVPAQGWGGSAGAVPVPALGLGPSVTKARSHPAPQPCPRTCSTLWAEPPLAKKPRTALGWSAGGTGCGHLQPSFPNELCSPLHRGFEDIPSPLILPPPSVGEGSVVDLFIFTPKYEDGLYH